MEQMKFCHSCGIPLTGPQAGNVQGDYCGNCVDDTGKCQPRAVVQAGVANWLMMFTPDTSMDVCMQRADHYLRAMPAWADK
jgi:hypothetical protein